ncbi:uncharacterized protein UV8b_02516 [Ustilaginoidea virens]|uniref:Borealin N-terminal domain-containing protein n=1 Tax=Ustilaginoidea virens TaxID=1159556 RepID=A0A8E5HMM9_USTVR|nr:uncharacterized protein UV8b_02516 [Ustilaginoidea virens]QUC18275.1 hypothetical protein UV8b_02516 [Ustilaginoidea virens]
MAPARTKKKVSDQSVAQAKRQGTTTGTQVAVKSPSTPGDRSPIRRRRMALSAPQKQALIDNLQLEITERARRLRAQYQLQAQGLRSRIEIRINRIPMALRKLKMGDLLQKYAQQEQHRIAAERPPVPAKDTPRSTRQPSVPSRVMPARRGSKRMSNAISGDKENEVENMDANKKRFHLTQADTGRPRPAQVLSPTTSNSRLVNRDRPASPIKSYIARPASPFKAPNASRAAAATSVLSSMVEKARATRARGTRKVTTASEISSSSNGTAATGRTRRPVGTAASRAPASRPATRAGHRVSSTSETSEASAGTVVRKASTSRKTGGPATRTTVMKTIRKGVAGDTKRAAASSKPAATTTTANATGRVLRKRG